MSEEFSKKQRKRGANDRSRVANDRSSAKAAGGRNAKRSKAARKAAKARWSRKVTKVHLVLGIGSMTLWRYVTGLRPWPSAEMRQQYERLIAK